MKRHYYLILNLVLGMFALASFFASIWSIRNLTTSAGCACPPDGWTLASAIKHIRRKQVVIQNNRQCGNFGCVFTYRIIPIDLIVLTAIPLIGIYILSNSTRKADIKSNNRR